MRWYLCRASRVPTQVASLQVEYYFDPNNGFMGLVIWMSPVLGKGALKRMLADNLAQNFRKIVPA
jgi:hypothetical protein